MESQNWRPGSERRNQEGKEFSFSVKLFLPAILGRSVLEEHGDVCPPQQQDIKTINYGHESFYF